MEKIIVKIHSQEEEDAVFEFMDVDNAGGVVYNYQGKPFSGIIEHYVDNVLVAEEEFTDGHIGGIQRKYYNNGQIQTEYYKYFGRMDKYYKSWDENGNLLQYTIWDDGERIRDYK
jgi:antitoxin component YwqK of YwqJK toxin-antitoxin module